MTREDLLQLRPGDIIVGALDRDSGDGKRERMELWLERDHNAHLRGAIETAVHDLAAINNAIKKRVEKLQELQRRAQPLEAFVRAGRKVLGDDRDTQRPAPFSEQGKAPHEACIHEAATQGKRTATAYARLALEASQRPMRTQEMAAYLEKHGLMQGRWTSEVLRTAMRTHPEGFECIRTGLYALREWPSTQKCVPER
jgi:hypothetical protein